MTSAPASPAPLPRILVTGASGFVGSHFLQAVKDDYYIYALGRRKQHASGVAPQENIQWLLGDLGEKTTVERIADHIASEGGVDYVFHFAGFYDFTNKDTPEYTRTNVNGTRFLLENSEKMGLQRFVFSSSLTVNRFSKSGPQIDESSPLDATIPYARSKQTAEDLIREYSNRFPCTIVRMAAIFSDWCEYGPLYTLLKKWLAGGWSSRLIAGRGETALPYLHIKDLTGLWQKIIEKHGRLSALDVILASPDGCLSHNEIYRTATRYFHGQVIDPFHVPVWLAGVGIIGLQAINHFRLQQPFERLWMLKYIDKRLDVNAEASRSLVDWKPTDRYLLGRRMLFLIENMKNNPSLWEERNLAMANKVVEKRPGLKIYEAMLSVKEAAIREHMTYLRAPENSNLFPHYRKLDPESLKIRARFIYEMLEVAILSGDRQHLLCYSNYVARQRYQEGIGAGELSRALAHNAEVTVKMLRAIPSLKNLQQRIHDDISLTMQLILDEIEDVYHRLGEPDADFSEDEKRCSALPHPDKPHVPA
jgi:nucleoside-diphosphate-sugar epimerase